MKKLLLLPLLTFFVFSVQAQKKFFFDKVEISNQVYFDDASVSKEGWKNLFKPPYKPAAQNFDSLERNYFVREWGNWNVKGGGAIQARLQKQFQIFGSKSYSSIIWKTGIGYRTFKMRSDEPFGSPISFADTTAPKIVEQETFRLKQGLVDVYNAAIYDLHISIVHFFVGAGFQASFSVRSRIYEQYQSWRYQWNSAQHTWNQTQLSDQNNAVPAKRTITYSWTIPFGIALDFSKKITVESGLEYINSRRSPRFTTDKHSEGLIFNLGIHYKL